MSLCVRVHVDLVFGTLNSPAEQHVVVSQQEEVIKTSDLIYSLSCTRVTVYTGSANWLEDDEI